MQGSRDNNEHMAFLDIGCECGVMKYAFFYTTKIEINPYSGLARYVTRLRMLQVGAGRRKCMDASEIHKFSTMINVPGLLYKSTFLNRNLGQYKTRKILDDDFLSMEFLC